MCGEVELFCGGAWSPPAAVERGDERTADVGEGGVGEGGAIRTGTQRAEESLQEAAEGLELFSEGELDGAGVGAHDENGHVVGREILRKALADFPEQRGDELLRGNGAEQIHD